MTKNKRRPDYDLSVLNKKTEKRGRVGAAWINDDGSISITLNPCVYLHNDSNEFEIRLFQRKEREEEK